MDVPRIIRLLELNPRLFSAAERPAVEDLLARLRGPDYARPLTRRERQLIARVWEPDPDEAPSPWRP